ncbi:hypothetical protein ACFYZ0_02205 [Streptomyces sp. NPDC001708]
MNETINRWFRIWADAWDLALALHAFSSDPESDLDTILAVEEALEVTHE